MEEAVYLFCLARSDQLPELRGEFFDDNALFQETLDNVAAIVSKVCLEDFVGAAAEARLEDLSWVGPRAVRHGEIIQKVASHSPVLPAKFGTLFSSIESLRGLLENHRAQMSDFLDYLTDKDEWSVKVLLEKSRVQDYLLSEKLAVQADDLASLPPGARYFKEKKLAAALEGELRAWLNSVCQVVGTDLADCSASFSNRRAAGAFQQESHREVIANWAFLVSRDSAPHFRERIHLANGNYEDQGLFFDMSGPWPPYSFTPELTTEA